jgi:hypothetical protein
MDMDESNDRTLQHRGSSPATNVPDRKVDVWGERRLHSIKETPEDSFATQTVVERAAPGK